AQRESFSRGCQEAARVLTSFVEEIRASGVPDLPGGVQLTEESGFEDGFPTVDLPSGDLGEALEDPELEDLPSQTADPAFTPPASPRPGLPAPPHPVSPSFPPPPAEARPARKGLGVAAKLRDPLGLPGLAGTPSPPPKGPGHRR